MEGVLGSHAGVGGHTAGGGALLHASAAAHKSSTESGTEREGQCESAVGQGRRPGGREAPGRDVGKPVAPQPELIR